MLHFDVEGAISAGIADFKIVVDIFGHMSAENCMDVAFCPSTRIWFKDLYPCLVRCGDDVEKLHGFVEELKALCKVDDRLAIAMGKWGCYPVGTFDKPGARDSVAEDVEHIGDSLLAEEGDFLS